MPNYRTCVFCNRNDSPPSREHVLAEWISKEFPDTEHWEMENIVNGKKFKGKVINLITRKACKRCNVTWMSKLESNAKPILIPLMKGDRALITPDRQLLIARWFIKTVITHEMLGDEPYYFQPEERAALQSSLSVPSPTMFFIGQYRDKRPGSTFAEHLPLLQGESTNRPVPIKGYAATFTIKQLALQVFSLRPAPDLTNNKILNVNLPVSVSKMSLQVWPIIDPLVRWPPPVFFDERGLKVFRDRFKKLRP